MWCDEKYMMDNDIAVSVKNLSKKYRLYDSPKHRLKEALHPFRKSYHRDFWVLRDINLDIPKGSTFGIVGQNGSGKSTLLQVICSILQPTEGNVQTNGRISALLELGSGFNKAFTGRENVYMQGAIMGIERKEMEERFDRIAEFADIGYFIDQPVKTYSSGMFVRLAFACAINVDPEILIVDEALAVGDAMFKRRCYRKIEDFQKNGKTILFVSHDLVTTTNLCNIAMFLDKGKCIMVGTPKEIVNKYSKELAEREAQYLKRIREEKPEKPKIIEDERLQSIQGDSRFGTGDAEIKGLTILNSKGEPVPVLETGELYTFRLTVLFKKDIREPAIGISLLNLSGTEICGTSTEVAKSPMGPVTANTTVIADFEQVMHLNPGSYSINASVAEFLPGQRVFLDRYLDMMTFKVVGAVRSYGYFDMNTNITITST